MLALFFTVLLWLIEAAFVIVPIVLPIVLWVQAYQSYHNDNDRGWIIVIVFALVFTSIGVKSTYKTYLSYTCDTVKVESYCCVDFDSNDSNESYTEYYCIEYDDCMVDACKVGSEYVIL